MHKKLAFALASIVAGSTACGDGDTITTSPDPDLVITTAGDLSDGSEDDAYEVTLRAEGGTGDGYRWSVIQGTLPTNVFLTSAGTPETVLSGTPRNNGLFNFTIQVEDSAGTVATQAFTLNIEAAPPAVTIVTEMLPEGATETLYEQVVESQDGSGEGYIWSLASGGLPPGLDFTAQGQNTTITGTPEAAGAFSFRLRVEDSKGDNDEQSLTIIVQDSTPRIELRTTIIPDGQVGVPYSSMPPNGGPVLLESQGGRGTARTWSVVNGELPPGVTLTVDDMNPRFANLSGVPTARGNYSFRIRVEDEDGTAAERTYFTTIDREPPPLRILTVELPDAAENVSYDAELSAVNGAGAGYMWEIIEGSLPPGLEIEPMGTPSTRIFGMPTTAGSFDFVVRVTDALGNSSSFLYTIRVAEEITPISIVSSNLPGGFLGQPYNSTLTAQDGNGSYNWVISEGTFPLGLDLAVPGTPSTTLAGIAGQAGTFTATITVYDLDNNTASRSFTLNVVDNALPLDITTVQADVAVAQTCRPYEQIITATEGSNFGYTWTIDTTAGDSLPAGFEIETNGTPSTRLTGIPSVDSAGVYNVVVRVEDSSGRVATESLSLEIQSVPGGQRWAASIGDVNADNVDEVILTDICRSSPGTPVAVNPSNSARDTRLNISRTNVQFSPDGRKVAFIGNWGTASGVDNLYLVDLTADTLAARTAIPLVGTRDPTTGVLEDPPTHTTVFTFRWSPDSNWISYVADQDTSSRNELYVVNVTNTAAPLGPFKVSGDEHTSAADVEDSSNGENVLFSPGSNKIAWIIDPAANVRELFVSDLSSGTPSTPRRVNDELPSTSSDVNEFKWANDDYLVFTADQEAAFRDYIYLADVRNIATAEPPSATRINPDFTSGDVLVMSDFTTTDDNPIVAPRIRAKTWDISPDGNRVYFIGGFVRAFEYEVNLVSIAGGVVGPNNIVGPTQSNGDVFSGAWSPDGTKIVYSGSMLGNTTYDSAVVEVGQGVTALAPAYQVTPPVSAGNFNGTEYFNNARGQGWSPDSRWVTTFGDYIVNGRNQIYMYDTSQGAGGQPIPVSDPDGNVNGDAENWLWSPDSSKILYEHDAVVSGQEEFNVFFVNDMTRQRIDVGTNRDVVHYLYPFKQMDMFWSVGSDRVFYLSDEGTDNVTEAWVRTVRGGEIGPAQRMNPIPPTNGDVRQLMVQTPGTPIYTWGGAN